MLSNLLHNIGYYFTDQSWFAQIIVCVVFGIGLLLYAVFMRVGRVDEIDWTADAPPWPFADPHTKAGIGGRDGKGIEAVDRLFCSHDAGTTV